MKEKITHYLSLRIASDAKETAALIRAVLHRHTHRVDMRTVGFDLEIKAYFYAEEDWEIAKRVINERFFNQIIR